MKTNKLILKKLAGLTSQQLEILRAILTGLIVVTGLTALTLIFQVIFEFRIYPFIQAEGINLGGKTPSQALVMLEQKVVPPSDKINLVFEDKEKAATWKELGIKIDLSSTVTQAYSLGRNLPYFKTAKDIGLNFKLNKDKLNGLVKQWDNQIIQDPQNAHLEAQGEEIIIIPEKPGQGIDESALKMALAQAALGKIDRVELKIIALEPELKSADLIETKQKAEEIISQGLKLTYEDKTFESSRSQKAQFLSFAGQEIGYSDEGIDKYLSQIAAKIEVKSVTKRIRWDGSIEEEGKDGLSLNRDQAREDIKSVLTDNTGQVALETKVVTRKVVQLEQTFTPGLYEGRYIEIDLSSQQLAIIDGSNVLGSYAISSGKSGMRTPTGTFKINNKEPRAYSSKYNLYMPYWMAFNGSAYGIHELPEWANGYKEGQNHLGTPVSHGCVRLGVGAAATVYGFADIGMPVYIHQ